MPVRINAPIAIIDEHPEWSGRLIAELERRGLPYEKIDHSSHCYDPRDRQPRHSVVVNRSSPSSHRRGHASVLFYAEPLLNHFESIGVPVINPMASYRFEKSKALQADLFERLGVRYPRSVVFNHPGQVRPVLKDFTFPVVIKPNVGGSGAGIERFDSIEQLEARLDTTPLGPDGTALLQEYHEAEGDAIVRIEILDGRYLYAIRLVRKTGSFNLCPADVCEVPQPEPQARAGGLALENPSSKIGLASGDRGRRGPEFDAAAGQPSMEACPVESSPRLDVARYEPPDEAVRQAIALTRGASIDVGGVEYLVSRRDGQIYFYDVNATSNFVADAPAVLGFDPFVPFVDYIERMASCGRQPEWISLSAGRAD